MSCTVLTLISSSTTRKEPTDYDLKFPVDVTQLPKFSVTDIWKNAISNPLRDRLMIEWLFSYSVAQQQLDAMVAKISEAIQQQLPPSKPLSTENEPGPLAQESVQSTSTSTSHTSSDSLTITEVPKLVVSVSCPSGNHYSPCFVEKLRETYQSDKTYNKQLVITTQHWDVLQRKKENFIWYKTKIHSSYVQHVEMLTNHRLWLPFDDRMNWFLEHTFQEDPYGSTVMVPNTTEVIDFVSGTLYDKQKRKTYYIRSTVLAIKTKQSLVKCRFIGDEAYKRIVRRYDAAGILFYSVHPQTGKAVFLLGHMTYGSYTWCDFGGLKSYKKLTEAARHTAARECCEETLGVLGSIKVLKKMLEDYKTNNVFKVINEVHYYVEHFLRIPFMDYPKMFDAVVDKSRACLEIDELGWFTMDAIRHAVQMGLSNERVMVNLDGEVSCELRVEFVHTLCIAEKLGILDSIDYITKQLHTSSLTPPPRPISYPKSRTTEVLSTRPPHTASAMTETCITSHKAVAPVELKTCDASIDKTIAQLDTLSKELLGSDSPLSTATSSEVLNSELDELSTRPPHTASALTETCTTSHKTVAPIELKTRDATQLEALSLTTSKGTPFGEFPLSTATSSEVINSELDDLVSRSQAWSFEEFVAGLSPEVEAAAGEKKRSPLLTGLRQKKGEKEVKKEKKTRPVHPTVKGKAVLYYGMGAGTFGI